MMKGHKREYLIIGLITFLMPVVILCVIFAYSEIVPFGNNSLIVNDFNNQYLSYFIYLKHNFFSIHNLFYSYSLSLGGNFFGITTYYLLSPFNLLFIIFPVNEFPIVITIMTIIKISCLAVTMYLYLGYLLVKYRRNMQLSLQKYDIRMTGLLAVSFSLMSFVINYKSNIMWLDSIILLPLIMLGLEQILDSKRPYLYIVTLSFSIILNYYIGFILCLFTGLFFIYRLSLFEFKKDNLKKLSEKIFNFVVASSISGALSAFILLPSFESVRLNGAVPYSFSDQLRFSPLDILPMVFSNVTVDTAKGGLPSISCGLLVVILLGLYFLKSKITIRERMTSFIFLILLVFSQSVLGTYLIWHGLTAPNGFPDRNAFIFSFIFVYLAFRAWCYHETWSSRTLSQLLVAYILGMLVLFKTYSNLITFHALVFDLVLGGLIIGSLYLLQNRSYRSIFLCLMIACTFDITLNAYHWQKMTHRSLAVSQFNRYYSSTQGIINKLKSKDTTFYRLGTTFMRADTDPLMFGYVGLSNYNSADNTNNVQFLNKVGYFQKYSYWRWMNYNNGATLGMDSLLGIKYLVTSNNKCFNQNFDQGMSDMGARNEINATSVWQQNKLGDNTQYQVYKNPLALGLVSLVSSKVTNANIVGNDNVFQIQNSIFDALNHKNNRIYQSNQVIRKGKNNYQIVIHHPGDAYAYLPAENWAIIGSTSTQAILSVDGKTISYGNQAENGIVRLGNFKKGQKVNLRIRPQDNKNQKQFNLIYQKQPIVQSENKNRLTRVLTQMKNTAPVTSISGTKISFKVDGSKQKAALLTIPYDASWHAVSNGQNVKLKKSFNNLLTVPLKSGRQKITLSFSPLGLKKGLVISFGGCLGLIIFGIYDEKKRHYFKEG